MVHEFVLFVKLALSAKLELEAAIHALLDKSLHKEVAAVKIAKVNSHLKTRAYV